MNTTESTKQNPAFQLQPTFVNVSKFRDSIDHLFRVVNSDFHACKGLKEYRYFHETLKRVFDRVALTQCKRAKPDDIKQFEKAIQAAIACFHKSLKRIDELTAVQSAIRSKVA